MAAVQRAHNPSVRLRSPVRTERSDTCASMPPHRPMTGWPRARPEPAGPDTRSPASTPVIVRCGRRLRPPDPELTVLPATAPACAPRHPAAHPNTAPPANMTPSPPAGKPATISDRTNHGPFGRILFRTDRGARGLPDERPALHGVSGPHGPITARASQDPPRPAGGESYGVSPGWLPSVVIRPDLTASSAARPSARPAVIGQGRQGGVEVAAVLVALDGRASA